jgi:hypothetical protein
VNGARSLGARIVSYDRYSDDRDAITGALAAEHGYTIVPSADDMTVMAGAGTAALELLRQAPGLSMLLVPVGGGGLAAGTAVAAKEINRHITVIGVEPRTGADTAVSLRAGHRVTLPAVPDSRIPGRGGPRLGRTCSRGCRTKTRQTGGSAGCGRHSSSSARPWRRGYPRMTASRSIPPRCRSGTPGGADAAAAGPAAGCRVERRCCWRLHCPHGRAVPPSWLAYASSSGRSPHNLV